jgi:glycosyltransferase involved in cell wall biosynthesis
VKVWILQTGEPLQIDNDGTRAMRAINLSNTLVDMGHDVILWSSNFDHVTKKHRYKKARTIKHKDNLKIILIQSIGYKNNQGFMRLIDHAQLALNLRLAIKKEPLPDIAFIGYPPIEVAWVMSKYLKKLGVPTVVDVKDKWPEILVRVLPKRLRGLGKFILTPYYILMKTTFKSAVSISSISNDFLNYSVSIAGREINNYDAINYLTNVPVKYSKKDLSDATDWLRGLSVYNSKSVKYVFVGSLTHSYDWNPVIESFKDRSSQLVIAGDGPCFNELQEKIHLIPNIVLTGRISSIQSRVLVNHADVYIAPYVGDLEFSESLPNKFFDALQFGKPILSSVRGTSGEFLKRNCIGLIFRDKLTLRKELEYLESNHRELKHMQIQAIKLYKEKYSGKVVYKNLVLLLEKIVDR